VGAGPGVLLALLLLLIPEPPLGQFDPHEKTPDRDTLKGLGRNPAFITATLGMAMMTFALGGLQVWMPTFLQRARGYTLAGANNLFGLSIAVNGLFASLAGGWVSDYVLRRTRSAHYLVSAVSLALGIPGMWLALYTQGRSMIIGIFLAEFLLLFNTGPLNAAVINSVSAPIRAMALAVNIFIFHLLGDVPSASLIGYLSDHYTLQLAFLGPVIAIGLSSAILFYGMKFAPPVAIYKSSGSSGTT
jgi:sugar phosphate permease